MFKITMNLTTGQVLDMFKKADRDDSFSYYGIEAILNRLSDLNDDAPIENIIEICHEYSEYSKEYFLEQYAYMYDLEEYKIDDDIDSIDYDNIDIDAIIDDFSYYTWIEIIDHDTVVLQDY